MGYDNNIVDSPEDYGLSFVGSIDLDDEPYQFYILAVLKDEAGFYLTTDSGCSCPSPFEDHMSRDDLTGPLTAEQAQEEIENLARDSRDASVEDVQHLVDRLYQ